MIGWRSLKGMKSRMKCWASPFPKLCMMHLVFLALCHGSTAHYERQHHSPSRQWGSQWEAKFKVQDTIFLVWLFESIWTVWFVWLTEFVGLLSSLSLLGLLGLFGFSGSFSLSGSFGLSRLSSLFGLFGWFSFFCSLGLSGSSGGWLGLLSLLHAADC